LLDTFFKNHYSIEPSYKQKEHEEFMAHSQSALKRARQNAKGRLRNREAKSELKSLAKKLLALITAKKKDEAVKAFADISSRFDNAAKRGIIHKNNASRHKSRLAQRLAKTVA
jgi:small subunit ribosomal protein S20